MVQGQEQPQRGGRRALIIASLLFVAACGGVIAWLTLAPPPEAQRFYVIAGRAVVKQEAARPARPAAGEKASTQAIARPIGGTVAERKATPPTVAAKTEPPRPPAAETRKTTEAAPAVALKPAPDPAMVEKGAKGPLPIIAADGRQPWREYARPFAAAKGRPRVALVVVGLGLGETATKAAIALPGAVTLAFSPYGTNLSASMAKARARGHETLLVLPMEPEDYPRDDPGPHTLLTGLERRQNMERLEYLLGRATGYVGVTNHMGAKFTRSRENLLPVLAAIKVRGLLFVDARSSGDSIAAAVAHELGLPRAANDGFLDAVALRSAIDGQLAAIAAMARKKGAAVAFAHGYPVTIERIARWLAGLDAKGMVAAPVSAVVATGTPK